MNFNSKKAQVRSWHRIDRSMKREARRQAADRKAKIARDMAQAQAQEVS